MKHLTISITMAAAVVLAAGSASAQTLKADIPFTFHAAGKVMSPGTYQVIAASNAASRYVLLRNNDTKESVLAMYSPRDAAKELAARGTPGMQFECSGARCALREIWSGPDHLAYGLPGPKLGSDAHMALIPLTVVKAD